MSNAADVETAAKLIRVVSPPVEGGIQARIIYAARRLKWEYSRAKAVWYGEARVIAAHEMRVLEMIAEARQERKEARLSHAEIIDRLSRLEGAIAPKAPSGLRPMGDTVQRSVGRSRALDRTGDR